MSADVVVVGIDQHRYVLPPCPHLWAQALVVSKPNCTERFARLEIARIPSLGTVAAGAYVGYVGRN